MSVNKNARATNKTIGELYQALSKKEIVAKPGFQRELVWNAKHQADFLHTILMGYPFPEIYLATGQVNVEEKTTTDLLVDGRQRLTTIQHYIDGNLNLGTRIRAWVNLETDEKERFLTYEVVVRHLGKLSHDQIIEVFRRINSTRYPLNSIEMRNAVYSGPLIDLAKELSEHEFFSKHRVFSLANIKRMKDTEYVLIILCTLLNGAYFHQDNEVDLYLQELEDVEDYLLRFNDEFPEEKEFESLFVEILAFIESLGLPASSRFLQKQGDLFTLIAELGFLRRRKVEFGKVDTKCLASHLQALEADLEKARTGQTVSKMIREYWDAVASGTAKRSARIVRGRAIASIIEACL